MKDIHKNTQLTSSLIVKYYAFPLRLDIGQRYLPLPLLFNIVLDILVISVRQKYIYIYKDINIREAKVKLFAGDIVF